MGRTITRDWIQAHKTVKGAWTKQQFQALGIPWPPVAGWMKPLEGREISDEQAQRFEKAKDHYVRLKHGLLVQQTR